MSYISTQVLRFTLISTLYIFIVGMVIAGISTPSEAQFGVCDRQAADMSQTISNDAAIKINNVQNYGLPQDETQAIILLYMRARDRAVGAVWQMRDQCSLQYIPVQRMMDAAVGVYTLGLSQISPQRFHVDVSEVQNGRPLGGPNAVIPKARDDALNRLGVGGDAAKIIRDTKKALPWNW